MQTSAVYGSQEMEKKNKCRAIAVDFWNDPDCSDKWHRVDSSQGLHEITNGNIHFTPMWPQKVQLFMTLTLIPVCNFIPITPPNLKQCVIVVLSLWCNGLVMTTTQRGLYLMWLFLWPAGIKEHKNDVTGLKQGWRNSMWWQFTCNSGYSSWAIV